MANETAIAGALKRAGVKTHVVAFDRAIALFQNNGGTFDDALERIRAAYGMQGEGQSEQASSHASGADALHNNGDAAAGAAVPQGQYMRAPASLPQGDVAGHVDRAVDGHGAPARPSPSEAGRVLRSVRTANEPNDAQRRMNAELAKVTALTVLDTVKVRGRGSWGDIAIGELRAIVTEGTRDAAIARLILRDVPIGTSTTKKVREIISLSSFQRAMQKAAEVVDVTVGEEVGHAA